MPLGVARPPPGREKRCWCVVRRKKPGWRQREMFLHCAHNARTGRHTCGKHYLQEERAVMVELIIGLWDMTSQVNPGAMTDINRITVAITELMEAVKVNVVNRPWLADQISSFVQYAAQQAGLPEEPDEDGE